MSLDFNGSNIIKASLVCVKLGSAQFLFGSIEFKKIVQILDYVFWTISNWIGKHLKYLRESSVFRIISKQSPLTAPVKSQCIGVILLQ